MLLFYLFNSNFFFNELVIFTCNCRNNFLLLEILSFNFQQKIENLVSQNLNK